ncbi:hypothetical protein [Solibacillus sp. CAU 1738]|uniref:hypothetical protein n=1 Tax=Solibacillus sp. CAU 1738 TaxID=3140363 RepID=UPI003260D691
MKFTRIITLSLISALSIGTLIGIAEVNKVPVDRNFEIEDEKGNRDALQSVAFENVIKVDTNKFEKVILTKDDVQFKDTKYDISHGVGEKVLNNKDMYRGMNNASEYENSKFTMIAAFNTHFPYGSNEAYVTIAKKDKKTNQLQKEKISLPGITTNQYIMEENLVEHNDSIYYSMVVQSMSSSVGPTLKIYQIQSNLQLKEVMNVDLSLPGDYTDVSRLVTDGDKLFIILSSQQEKKLMEINLDTNKYVTHTLPELSMDDSYIQMFRVDENHFYLNVDNSMFVIDKNTYKQVNQKVMKPSFISKYDYISVVDQTESHETVYVIYEGYKNYNSDKYVVAYHATTGDILYEGKLPSTENRGVSGYKFVNVNN